MIMVLWVTGYSSHSHDLAHTFFEKCAPLNPDKSPIQNVILGRQTKKKKQRLIPSIILYDIRRSQLVTKYQSVDYLAY